MKQRFGIRSSPVVGALRNPVHLAWLAAFLFCAAIFGITGWRLLHAYQLELERSRVTTLNLARAVTDHAKGTIRDAEIVLEDLVERLEVDGVSSTSVDRIHRFLVSRVASISTIHHLVVFSAEGDALTASFESMSPVNVADRPYFVYHRAHDDAHALIGPALRNRGDGRWSLTVSRRLELPGGAFGGVVVAVIACDTFTNFYASLDVGAHGSIALSHENRTIVVRHPAPPNPDYRSTPLSQNYWDRDSGSGQFVSALDGVPRLYSFQRVAGMPLVAIVAVSKADALASWLHDGSIALTVCSVVSGALSLLGWGLVHQIRRSERREAALDHSEQRYRLLAEHSTDVIIQLGPDSVCLYVSPACERLFEYRPEEMQLTHLRDTTHPEDWPALQQAIAEMLRTGRSEPITYRCRRKTGGYLWVETLGQRLDGDHGFIVAIREATHRKRAEARLLEEVALRETAQTQLAHSQRTEALGQLAGGVAHDFNNVLQTVQGGAHLIAQRAADGDGVHSIARMISEAAERGASVTQRLLSFSRRGDLRAEDLDPAALLSELRQMFEHTLGSGIEIRIETKPHLPSLLADKGQLETVIINLATNARDAMPDGGVLTMSATLHVVERETSPSQAGWLCPPSLQAGPYICLMVSDNGVGIEPGVLSRVGEPFFTTKPQGKGTGLGLAMAKGFAEQSGGTFAIESTPGLGTTVAIWLPASANPAVPRLLPSEKVPSSRTSAARILVVDDDELVREVIAAQLVDAGFNILTAASGAAALTLLDSDEQVDLVVSDFSMPGMHGLCFISKAQQRRHGLPAILLTGFMNDVMEKTAHDPLGSNFVLLRKPIGARALVDRVSALLEKSRDVNGAYSMATEREGGR